MFRECHKFLQHSNMSMHIRSFRLSTPTRLRISKFLPNFLTKPYSSTSDSSSSNIAFSEAEIQSSKDYCSGLLRKHDTPSHILLAFVPPPAQSAYLALRAFNLEIARIPDTTSTPAVSAMRYQFWRDNITRSLSGTPPKQPVCILLSSALASLAARSETGSVATLSKPWFTRIIAAREKHSDGRPYTSLDALEKYAEDTYSTLLYLTLQSLPLASVTADHIASHVGKAMGIAAVLRGLPLLAFPGPANHHSNNPGTALDGLQRTNQGSVALPLDVTAKAGVRDEDVLRMGADAPGLRDAVFEVATRASDHLITARQMVKNVMAGQDVGHAFEYEEEEEYRSATAGSQHDREMGGKTEEKQKRELDSAFGVLMPAVATSLWLDRLQKYDFDVFRNELRRREWKLPWKAYLAFRRKMF